MTGRAARLQAFQREASTCTRCHAEGLLFAEGERRAYPLFQKDPIGAARVLVVAEAPNADDTFDATKRRLTYEAGTDPTGTFATRLLESVGLRVEDVVFTNAVLCLPAHKEGKYPVLARQVELCSPWLQRLIDSADPLVVVTFGVRALEALNQLEPHGLKLKESVGMLHPWRGRQLLPLYHPGLLGRANRPEAQQLLDVRVLGDFLARGDRLDVQTVQQIMKATQQGARLVLRGDGQEAEDVAFTVGFRWEAPARFAYLSPQGPLPFAGHTCFFVEGVTRIAADVWLVRCRHESGISEIEIKPLPTDSEKIALRRWIDGLPPEAVEHAEATMRSMLDHKSL